MNGTAIKLAGHAALRSDALAESQRAIVNTATILDRGLDVVMQTNPSFYLTARRIPADQGAAIGDWYDASGNGQSGSQTTGARKPVLNGAALDFDGTDDLITIPHASIKVQAPPLTYACRFRLDQTAGSKGETIRLMVKKRGSSPWAMAAIQVNTDNLARCVLVASGGTNYSGIYTQAPIAAGVDYVIVGTISGAFTATVYINGIAGATTATGPSAATTDDEFRIGADAVSGLRLDGRIYWAATWGRVLSAAEIKAISSWPG